MNWRIHAITLVVLFLAIGAFAFVWNNPKVIFYVILGVIGVLAYGAIYLVVKARMERHHH